MKLFHYGWSVRCGRHWGYGYCCAAGNLLWHISCRIRTRLVVLLAMGYAAGATAPIMVTAAVVMSRGSVSLLNPVMALPFHLYILFSQHISLERAYGTALVLVLILLALNLLSLYLRNRYGKRVAFYD